VVLVVFSKLAKVLSVATQFIYDDCKQKIISDRDEKFFLELVDWLRQTMV